MTGRSLRAISRARVDGSSWKAGHQPTLRRLGSPTVRAARRHLGSTLRRCWYWDSKSSGTDPGRGDR